MTQANESRTLLVVDDDISFCAALARAMQRRSYHVVTAHDEAGALQAANDFAPKYALVDLRLGQASGLSLVQQLVQHDAQMRIVVLTGYASIATAVEAIKLGAMDLIEKPADLEALGEKIKKAKQKKMLIVEKANEEKIMDALKRYGV